MTNLGGLPSSLGNSLNSSFLAKGVTAEFHKAPGDQKSAAEAPSSSFMDGLGSFLGKTLSGGLALASLGSTIVVPGVSFGLSKLGDATASSLLHGLLSSNSSSTPGPDVGALAGLNAIKSHHPYQAQPASFPGAKFTTAA
jgi:hypothetical protein